MKASSTDTMASYVCEIASRVCETASLVCETQSSPDAMTAFYCATKAQINEIAIDKHAIAARDDAMLYNNQKLTN